tara:strand:+ start:81 stop:1082 length:1002 start_codon:yes stop_codon:yes gene_type:complete
MNEVKTIFYFFFFPCVLFGQELEWYVSANDFEHSSSLTCLVIDYEGVFMTQPVLIGVFDSDDICVGLGYSDTYFPPINANLAFLTIFANQLEINYSVKVFIGEEVYDAGDFLFIANDILGSFESPYIISPYYTGCTDQSALNYNSLAIEDDGTCEYITEGCTDMSSFNYNADANTDDGSCIAKYFGCFNDSFIEYNELANFGDQQELCLTEIIYGCLNDCYIQFDSFANSDNGTCLTTWKESYYELIELQSLNNSIYLNLDEGWNMIGFSSNVELEVELAFDCIFDKVVLVKNNFGQVFLPEFNFNSIGSLYPGMGYQIKTSESIGDFIFCNY